MANSTFKPLTQDISEYSRASINTQTHTRRGIPSMRDDSLWSTTQNAHCIVLQESDLFQLLDIGEHLMNYASLLNYA